MTDLKKQTIKKVLNGTKEKSKKGNAVKTLVNDIPVISNEKEFIEIITDSDDEIGNMVDSHVEKEKAQEEALKSETIATAEPKKKYFFKFVELPRVKTEVPETLELLKLRISKKKIENNTETASKIFQAIDSEVERLHDVKINQIFLTGAIKISEDIHNKFIQTEKITFNQLVCSFNILYGLSKCF